MVLASGSPRRKQLLGELLRDFEVVVSNVPEELVQGEKPRSTAERLARLKAESVGLLRPKALVIGADTVVAVPSNEGWVQLGKPEDELDAARMLRMLSGIRHSVVTGICLVSSEGTWCSSEETLVAFRQISELEIQTYVETGEPMDKAGAYAIQGEAASFVQAVEGSLSNVIGLPMEALSEYLRSLAEQGRRISRGGALKSSLEGV